MKTPDITPVQIVGALLGAIYPILVLVGIDLDSAQKDALDNLVALGAALIGGDAIVRFGRSRLLAPGAGVPAGNTMVGDFDDEDPDGKADPDEA
jgi:hypothetical protein